MNQGTPSAGDLRILADMDNASTALFVDDLAPLAGDGVRIVTSDEPAKMMTGPDRPDIVTFVSDHTTFVRDRFGTPGSTNSLDDLLEIARDAGIPVVPARQLMRLLPGTL